MKEYQDLTGKFGVLNVDIKDWHKALDQARVGWLECIWELLSKVLSDRLNCDQDLPE